MSFLKCTHCFEPLDEDNLVSKGLTAIKKPQRIVTLGQCPNCECYLTVTWTCEDIEAGPAMFEAEDDIQL
jgi:hypothetical protein